VDFPVDGSSMTENAAKSVKQKTRAVSGTLLRAVRMVLSKIGRTAEAEKRTVVVADFDPGCLPDFGFTPKSGRYASAQEVARGGMGAVYKVLDQDLRRTTAMKVALPVVLRYPENAAYFVDEARITASLEHPNVVPVHDIGCDADNGLFFTMKYVEGEPLDEIIEKVSAGCSDYPETYDLHQRLLIFRKVCDAVAFAHSRQVVHLDLKPENIMVGDYGEVLVMDWGIARQLQNEAAPAEGEQKPATRRSAAKCDIRGTPAYMAPEQARGEVAALDAQTDVFLLGSCLYHLLAFVPPYLGDTECALKLAEAAVPMPPHEANPLAQIPDELGRIALKAMSRDKVNRYPDVRALVADLDNFMSGRVLTGQRVFEKDEELMRAGDEGTEAYVILQGRVEVYHETRDGRVKLTELGPGEIVGEMALITHRRRSATCVAVEKTVVQVVTQQHMEDVMRKMPPWLGRSVRALAERLQRVDGMVHPLLVENCFYHVLEQVTLLRQVMGEDATCHDTVEHRFPLQELEQRVALNLALPTVRVWEMLKMLAEHTELARMTDDGQFCVADKERLARFVEYCKFRIPFRPGAGDRKSAENEAAALGADESQLFAGYCRALLEAERKLSCR
jgi:CRP-like cAMP-binding protein